MTWPTGLSIQALKCWDVCNKATWPLQKVSAQEHVSIEKFRLDNKLTNWIFQFCQFLSFITIYQSLSPITFRLSDFTPSTDFLQSDLWFSMSFSQPKTGTLQPTRKQPTNNPSKLSEIVSAPSKLLAMALDSIPPWPGPSIHLRVCAINSWCYARTWEVQLQTFFSRELRRWNFHRWRWLIFYLNLRMKGK